ncbi:MAG: TlpA disulfide reductase family protein [Polyangiaceae bacterium]
MLSFAWVALARGSLCSAVGKTSIVVAFVATMTGCGRPSPAAAPAPAAPGTSAVPLGPAVDYGFDSLDERPVGAAAHRGKVTVLSFVTTASLPSQAQVDFLVAMARHDGERVNYAVVALESRENRELVAIYGKALSIPFPLAMADARTLAGQGPFGDVGGVPVTFVLDREGRIVCRISGRVAKSDEIRKAMGGL